jgi:hypothetical protein
MVAGIVHCHGLPCKLILPIGLPGTFDNGPSSNETLRPSQVINTAVQPFVSKCVISTLSPVSNIRWDVGKRRALGKVFLPNAISASCASRSRTPHRAGQLVGKGPGV